jgi:hypothetical protein
MIPPYQIDSTLPFAAKVNSDLANIQKAAAIVGADEALGQAYSAAVTSYAGDPTAGTIMQGSTMPVNAATTVQRMLQLDFVAGGTAGNLDAILAANTGPAEPWNFSYNQWGLPPGTSLDPSLKTAQILVNNNGVVSTQGPGILLS